MLNKSLGNHFFRNVNKTSYPHNTNSICHSRRGGKSLKINKMKTKQNKTDYTYNEELIYRLLEVQFKCFALVLVEL